MEVESRLFIFIFEVEVAEFNVRSFLVSVFERVSTSQANLLLLTGHSGGRGRVAAEAFRGYDERLKQG